ncbi:MAG: TIGR04283 family arsenosugar biosynthesis glycosyltransferase [Alphaproteobacteria bacterium]
MSLAIVTPVVNGGFRFSEMLSSVKMLADELIVVDGGSSDNSPLMAERAGAKVISTTKGRGLQCAAGATHATADWILFLHADTILTEEARLALISHVRMGSKGECAWYFELRFDDDSAISSLISRLANWRSRVFGLPYGDQGLLIHRDFYNELGGYSALPLMEDVDFIRRIGRSRLRAMSGHVVTSAARYRQRGWITRSLRNLLCLSLYFLGMPPRWIVRIYD